MALEADKTPWNASEMPFDNPYLALNGVSYNLLGLADGKLLREREYHLTDYRQKQLSRNSIPGDFDLEHFSNPGHSMDEKPRNVDAILRTMWEMLSDEPIDKPAPKQTKRSGIRAWIKTFTCAVGRLLLTILGKFLLAVFCVAGGIVIVLGVLFLTFGVGAGIIWLTWDHMDGIWSIALALLGVMVLINMMPSWMWLTAEQDAMAKRVADMMRARED
jgi:hypothetical protein